MHREKEHRKRRRIETIGGGGPLTFQHDTDKRRNKYHSKQDNREGKGRKGKPASVHQCTSTNVHKERKGRDQEERKNKKKRKKRRERMIMKKRKKEKKTRESHREREIERER